MRLKPPAAELRRTLLAGAAVGFGASMTLLVAGYSFGQSNHHIYLLDALRLERADALARDWFVSRTLQYHVIFTRFTWALRELGWLKAGFFVGHLACVLLMHLAWWTIVRRVGGTARTYVLSVVLFYVSAGGLGLGSYRFMQDGSFLPSNVAAVCALAALAFWLRRKIYLAAFFVGVAGLFHLNYAVVGAAAWVAVGAWHLWREEKLGRALAPRALAASLLALGPCALNVGLAAGATLGKSDGIPLDEFVDVYVRLRHSHHYQPAVWPIALWAGFLWPLPVAFVAYRLAASTPERRKVGRVFAFATALQLVALVGAGVFWVSESLVQMSLWRFSIFSKLLACVGTAWLVCDGARVRDRTLALALLAPIATVFAAPFLFPPGWRAHDFARASPTLVFGGGALLAWAALFAFAWRAKRHPWAGALATGVGLALLPMAATAAALGLAGPRVMPESDADLVALAHRARAATPADALFVVPPDDSAFRLEAERAVVVSYKHVPQLSGELPAWRKRLEDVLGMDDALQLRRPMLATLADIKRRYAALPPAHLRAVAAKYGATHVVAARHIDDPAFRPVAESPAGGYWLYEVDTAPAPATLPAP